MSVLDHRRPAGGMSRVWAPAAPCPLPPPVPEPALGDDPRPTLQPHSALDGHPAPGSWLLKVVRGGLKRLALPWLTLQTRFNHGLIDLLERQNTDLRAAVRTLSDRLDRQEQMLQAFGVRLSDGLRELAPRPAEVLSTPEAEREHLLLSWLPRPPARVLCVSHGPDDVSHGLPRFGYEVRTAEGITAEFADGSFHAVVRAEGAAGDDMNVDRLEEVYRVLRPGGRLIAFVCGHEADGRACDELAAVLDGFRILATVSPAAGHDRPAAVVAEKE